MLEDITEVILFIYLFFKSVFLSWEFIIVEFDFV